MTRIAQNTLKKYGAVAGSFLLFLALLYGLSYLNTKIRMRSLAAAADTVCRSAPFLRNTPLTISGSAEATALGLPFHTVLSASLAGKQAFIVFLPLTGKFGSYPAVFMYEKAMGCIFCGLAGLGEPNGDAGYYGITQTAIDLQCKKIEYILHTAGEVKHD